MTPRQEVYTKSNSSSSSSSEEESSVGKNRSQSPSSSRMVVDDEQQQGKRDHYQKEDAKRRKERMAEILDDALRKILIENGISSADNDNDEKQKKRQDFLATLLDNDTIRQLLPFCENSRMSIDSLSLSSAHEDSKSNTESKSSNSYHQEEELSLLKSQVNISNDAKKEDANRRKERISDIADNALKQILRENGISTDTISNNMPMSRDFISSLQSNDTLRQLLLLGENNSRMSVDSSSSQEDSKSNSEVKSSNS